MKKLGELFDVYNGIASSNLEVKLEQFDNLVPFIRPSSKFENTVVGYIDPKGHKAYNKGEIFISTNGEGSHTFTYVAPWDSFIPNSDVAVLVFKSKDLSFVEKQYYAQYITKCRPLFSYGRKPKGNRLKNLLIPELDELPSWIYEIQISDYSYIKESKTNDQVDLQIKIWHDYKLSDLFNIVKGKGPSAKEAKDNPGLTPYLGASAFNNGITHYSNHTPEHDGNVITIATDGSVGETFYQPNAFCATSNIAVLELKKHLLNPSIAMFIITIILLEKSKYSYGRKYKLSRVKNTVIKLPAKEDGEPDYEYVERFINSLPYSKTL
jgi:hypothetical protein